MSNDSKNTIDELFDYYDDETEKVLQADVDNASNESTSIIEHIVNEVPEEMSKEQAREITESIKAASVAVYVLIAKAHEGKAYKALGYESFESYVKTEFDLSRNRAYQLLNLSNTVKAIESATPDGTEVKLTEIQARDIKRELPKITERVESETSGKDAEESADIVSSIVEEERARLKEEKATLASEDNATDDDGDSSDKKWSNAGSDGNYIVGEETENREKQYQEEKNKQYSENGGYESDGNDTNAYVNNVDSALNAANSEDDDEEYGVGQWKENAAQTRPAAVKTDDIVFFLDFVERVENFPSVHQFLSSLTSAQRKIISRKAMSATDYLNELMDELAIGEMSQ